jgi:hypothetical protein
MHIQKHQACFCITAAAPAVFCFCGCSTQQLAVLHGVLASTAIAASFQQDMHWQHMRWQAGA